MAPTYHIALLCGMFTEHLEHTQSRYSSLYGVGVMLRAKEIREVLMSNEMRNERLEWDGRRQPRVGPKLKKASRSAGDDEYTRFTDLARRLVQVPKSEVDERRKKQEG
jgi:hypothetical protein